MKSIIGFLVQRALVVNLISIFLLLLGVYAAFSINREAFPNVNLDVIQIDMRYPGTSPTEVEQLVVTPIEQEIRSLNGIDKMVSMSFPGSGRIILELAPNAPNRDRMSSDVTLAINRAILPKDLPFDPVVTEIDGAVFPIMRLALSAPLTPLELQRLADRIENDLLNIDGVAQIAILGDRKAELRVVVDSNRLIEERISGGEIARQLGLWNLNTPGGEINTPTGQKVVRVIGQFSSAEDAAQLVLRANERGDVTRLGDVATITETLAKPQTLYSVSGKPGLSMLVLKKTDADIINTVDAVKQYMLNIPARYGESVSVTSFQDFSKFARMRLGVLTNNGMVGLLLVFVSLLLFLRFSVAITTTIGLPIIFMSGLFVLYLSGITLNMLSMMGFIMVLGMLVDDAIIIGENITYHMERGLAPMEAATTGALELLGPVTTTIMTTIVAFLPMLFMSGMIGKFVMAIPTAVIVLLLFSWLQSFLILPTHVAHVTNANKHPPERMWLSRVENYYVEVLKRAIKFRWLTVLLSAIILVLILALGKTLSFQLFPPAGVEEFIVRVTAKTGTNINSMDQYLKAINTEIRSRIDEKYLDATILKSGDISMDKGDPLTQRGSRYGQIRAIYLPAVSRPGHDALTDMYRLADEIPALFPELKMSFVEVRPGPPVGRALNAEIFATDDKTQAQAAQQLMVFLATIPGVTNIDSGLTSGDDEVHVQFNRSLATYAGIDLATASRHIRAATGGLVVSTIRRGAEEIDVTIRYAADVPDELQRLKQILIPNNRDGLVPLYKIATFEITPGSTTIRHKSGARVVNVVSDVDVKVLTSVQLNNIVRDAQSQWLAGLNDKVKINYGGEEEKNKESIISLVIAFVFALIGIFFILAIQFNNLSYPIIVMLAIPFGAIGIVVSFFLHDLFWKPMPLSFMSMLGMIALTGVVVNSSLILLVFIQRARIEGMETFEAIVQAGKRRLRAVLLTATTTVVGLLPTAYGWGGMDPFVSPMALALSWGLMFATVITLVTIPAVLAIGVDIKKAKDRLWLRIRPNKPIIAR
ncbi:MAG: efflux RND transporter permease subunit [Thiohalomonadales bacterium]